MNIVPTRLSAPAMALLAASMLAACSQSDAPSEQMGAAAEEVVRAVEGQPSEVTEAPFAPRDACSGNAGADEFLAELGAAIKARDADVLVALSADDVKLDFGEGSGAEELRSRLGAADGALWEELDEIVALGCATNAQGGITLPYYFAQQMPVDAGKGFIVTGDNVPLRNAPGADAPVVTRLSWRAVEQLGRGAPVAGYRHVRVAGKRGADGEPFKGYVADEHLRSMLDYRLTAASRNGTWRIISLLAGD